MALSKGYAFSIKYAPAKSNADYTPNINKFIAEKCTLIIGVGFLLGDAIAAAANLIELAEAQTEEDLKTEYELETEEMKLYQQGLTSKLATGASKILKDLEREQKLRKSRATKDKIDGYLSDYASFLIDCLSAGNRWVNEDLADELQFLQSNATKDSLISLLSKLLKTRELLTSNTSQLMVLETFFLEVLRLRLGKEHAFR